MISVILLVYNGETYLRQCLDSVVTQTLGMENIELIALNDVSTDNSLNILKEYQALWPDNIRIVNREINSVSIGESNRNLGVELATGKYILFLDQDDWYDKNAFYHLKKLMDDNLNLDFIEYSFCYTDVNKKIFREQHVQEKGFHIYQISNENMQINLAKSGLLPCSTFVWTKIYRKEFLQINMIKENGKKFQDNFFSGLLNLYCTNFGKYDALFYNYRNYIGSGSHQKILNDKTVFKRCSIGLDFYEECKNRGLLKKYSVLAEFIFTNTFFIKPFWRLLFMFSPIPYQQLRDIQNTMNTLFPNVKDNVIVRSKPYVLELVNLLDKEWSDDFLQNIYQKRVQMYEKTGQQFNAYLGR